MHCTLPLKLSLSPSTPNESTTFEGHFENVIKQRFINLMKPCQNDKQTNEEKKIGEENTRSRRMVRLFAVFWRVNKKKSSEKVGSRKNDLSFRAHFHTQLALIFRNFSWISSENLLLIL